MNNRHHSLFIGTFGLFLFLMVPAISSAAPTFTRPLYIGAHGPDVSALQQFLKDKSYFTYPSITGLYGTFTYKAVAAFQTANHLEGVGNVGPLTRTLLNTSLAGTPSAAAPTPPSSTASATALASTTVPCSAPAGLTCVPGTSLIQPYAPSNGYTPGFGGGGSPATPAPPADVTPPVISSISSGTPGLSTSTITWTTNEAANSQVEYGTTNAYGSSTTLDPSLVTSHSATISILTASTTYHFRVRSSDASGNLATSGDQTFTTTIDWDSSFKIAATRGEVSQNITNANGALKERLTRRSRHKTGGQPLLSLEVAYSNYYINVSGVETNVGNSLQLEEAIEIPTAPTQVVRVTFSGNASTTMANGEPLLVSDAVPASSFGLSSIPAGTIFYVRTQLTSSGLSDWYPFSITADNTVGESGVLQATSSASQVMNTGALVQTGGLNSSAIPTPTAILGRFAKPVPASVVIVGDSIAWGSNDSAGDGQNGGGYLRRALWDVGGGRAVPWVMEAKPGDWAQRFVAGSTKRQAVWPYATNLYDEYGTNDGAGSRTPAQVLGDNRTI